MKKRKKLRVALAALLSGTVLSSVAVADTPANNSLSDSFERAANALSTNFNAHGRIADPVHARRADVRAVQMEGYDPPSIQLDPTGRIYFTGRHGQAAADIVENTAELFAQMDIPTYLINAYLLYGLPTGNLETVARGADIISMSYDAHPSRTRGMYRANLPLPFQRVQNDTLRQSLLNLWRDSNAITIQAAGNGGFRSGESLTWKSEGVANFNDTHISVGGVVLDGNNTFIIPYSSASAPSVVTLNPYHFGFDYSYYADKAEVERALREFFGGVTIQRAPSASTCSGQTNPGEFDGRDLLNELSANRRDLTNASEEEVTRVREALISCYLYAYDQLDTTALEGTSFATPYMSGIMAAVMGQIRAEYGDVLTAQDFVAATFLAAQPVWQARDRSGSLFDLDYTRTQAGLLYNDNLAGFGYISYDALIAQARYMAERVTAAPDLRTRHFNFESETATFTGTQPVTTDGFTAYQIPVTRDGVTLRMTLELTFNGSHNTRPDVVYLESPTGERFRVVLTREAESDRYVFAFTNGMFGTNTQGNWRILVPQAEDGSTLTPISTAKIHFAAVERGGVINDAIREHNRLTPANDEARDRVQPRQNTIRYNAGPR